MPRYFIDLHDGANFVKDTVGFEVPDENAVRARVLGVMNRYARSLNADAARQDLFILARDEMNRVVLRSHLALEFEVLDTA